MNEMKKLSNRAKQAVQVLQAGGKFSERLERNFNGHMKFVTRLHNAAGVVVAGFGNATRSELSRLLRSDIGCAGTSRTWRLYRAEELEGAAAVQFDEIMQRAA